jgi:hypothetical protein
MSERSYDDFITDEASGQAWRLDLETATTQLSELARVINLEEWLLPAELIKFRDSLKVAGISNPDDFLKTRIYIHVDPTYKYMRGPSDLISNIEQQISEQYGTIAN